MTQKNKVKELVGRGLDSYHTKSLQQIDRIEKKNKEQNHKISILSNKLDNDYLTKTEEGSVISLEHSKEGMVYLDELQGNTLVNYCTDGSKEMTLNGDIDVEGTFVTTTEGVDGGKIDVMCEGNTLVNLVDKMLNNNQPALTIDSEYITIIDHETNHRQNYYTISGGQLNLIKPNTTYTIIAEITKNTLQRNFTLINNFQANGGDITSDDVSVPIGFVGRYVGKFTTLSDFTNRDRLGFSAGSGNRGEITLRNNFIILEGDWTNRDIPASYFKGIKSVGQDDTNGHKIEILSQNKNLIHSVRQYNNTLDRGVSMTMTSDNTLQMNGTTTNSNGDLDYTLHNSEQMDIYLKPNKDYVVNFEVVSGSVTPIPSNAIKITDLVTGAVEWRAVKDSNKVIKSSVNPRKVSWIRLAYSKVTTFDNYKYRVQIEEGNTTTSYVKGLCNKKEILLNEPLRGLPNGVRDRFVKLGGKWYIERNCVEYTPDTSTATFRKHYNVTSIIDFKIDNVKNADQMAQTFYMECLSTIPYGDPTGTVWQNETHWLKYYPMTKNTISPDNRRDKGSVSIFYNKEWTDQQIIDWCNNNNLKFILPCETPTYEEITDVELMTYLDTTHISNNSTIPCNMKIKNSGYNAIIKPSTLYTVALDTNKNGTIGINLGGAKVTTTNNVATITTPATLTDDSLRLYGKGINASKVRLLEGDKTNWMPSHFEGMKSSFEDKFDVTDNTYKMEILMKNKNLLDLTDIVHKAIGEGCRLDACSTELIQYTSNQEEWTNIFFMMKLKPFTRYTLSAELQSMNVYVFNDRVGNWDANKYIGAMQNTTNTLQKKQFSFTTNKTGCVSIRFTNERMLGVNIAKNIMLSEVVGDYTSKKSNKIQFSSIEPLRRYKNSTDKFVFKDNKLMIERNCAIKIFNGSENWNYSSWINNNGKINRFSLDANMPSYSYQISNKYKYIWGDYPDTYYRTDNGTLFVYTQTNKTLDEFKQELKENNLILLGETTEQTYEEIPFELQKIILEGYENGTLFFDTNIPPTSTVTYAGETPIVKATKLNKTEVLNNTNDINDNIVPYLMDMDYRVVCLQLQSENTNNGISMARLFGGTYEMLQRDIQSKRYSMDEYKHRLDAYLDANKITEEEYNKLGDMLNE